MPHRRWPMTGFNQKDYPYTEDLETWAKVIINKLAEAGVGFVTCRIHGSGDSPDGEDWTFFDNLLKAERPDGQAEELVIPENAIPAGLTEEMAAFFWDWCDQTGHSGWYNNEGGYMDLEIRVKCEKPEVKCELWEYPEPEAALSVANTY